MKKRYHFFVFTILFGGIIYFMPPFYQRVFTLPEKNISVKQHNNIDNQAARNNYSKNYILNDSPNLYYNKNTLNLLLKLQSKFKKIDTIEEHLEMVREFLLKRYPMEKANALFELYKKFLYMQIELRNIISTWPIPESIDDMIQRLEFIEKFRKDTLGKDIAELLYGEEIKKQKFIIEKESIIYRDDLYAEEKMQLINDLKDRYGDVINNIGPNDSYTIYKETLELYKKDLEDIPTKEEKEEKIREIRKNLFSEEVVKRLEQVDRQMEEFNLAMQRYNKEKKEILSNSSLTEEQKNLLLDNIRIQIFGKDAEGIKRIENMEVAKRQLMRSKK